MDPRFQPAQAALAAGDLPALAALFAADPDLATAVSSQSVCEKRSSGLIFAGHGGSWIANLTHPT